MHFLPSKYGAVKRAMIAVGSVCFLLTSGCAQYGGAAQPPSEAEACSSLRSIIAASDRQFREYKTTPTINPLSGMTKWETRPVFPNAQCDVLEWAGGRTNYVCTWPQGNEAQARETYRKHSALIGRCLDQTWARSDTSGQTGGATVFTKPGKSTQVVMRYFRPRRGFGTAWETSLTIGDEVTSEP